MPLLVYASCVYQGLHLGVNIYYILSLSSSSYLTVKSSPCYLYYPMQCFDFIFSLVTLYYCIIIIIDAVVVKHALSSHILYHL